LAVNAEINVTNLVDVAFVLLIIFMITAPILQGGIEVQLPEATATPLNAQDNVTVSIDSAGGVYIERVKMSSMEEFDVVLQTRMEGGEKLIALRADGRLNVAGYHQVMDRIRTLGFGERLGLIVQPPPRRR
jgi:biopolymer transport protein ExbD